MATKSWTLSAATQIDDSVWIWWDNSRARTEIFGGDIESSPSAYARLLRATGTSVQINMYGDDPYSTIIIAVARIKE